VKTSKTGNRKHCERRERSMEGPLKTTLARCYTCQEASVINSSANSLEFFADDVKVHLEVLN